MLGYLQIQKSELLVKEAEIYKAVYCGLCRTLGKDYSIFCRAFLSYDFTFYAILSMAIEKDACPGFTKGRCCCNPLKSCNYCKDHKGLHVAAALTVITAYYKLCDDIADSGFFKSNLSRLIRLFVSRHRKKAMRKFPELDVLVSDMIKKQTQIESLPNPEIDVCCEPTALMLSGVFSYLSDNENNKRILADMGYHIGRWIYLADAVDDIEKDIKNGGFNCLSQLRNNCSNTDEFKFECNALMNMDISGGFLAYELLDTHNFAGILSNHFVYGMPYVQKKIINKEKRKGNENE